jgi:hypothetical protein
MPPHIAPQLRLKPQTQTVLNHLRKTGSITFREAVADHSVQSLTKRIQELRAAGFPINTKFKRHPLTKQRYAEYQLER